MRSLVRRLINRLNPALLRVYRSARAEWVLNRQKACVTPFGFKLMGQSDMQSGKFEPEETEFILKALREADVFIDIGANVGYYTCMARSLGVRTIAIEPSISNLQYLYANLQYNGWNDVEVWPLALGAFPCLTDLYGEGTGASLVRGWAGTPLSYYRSVPSTTLDIIIGTRFQGKRLFFKIDVEGSEYSVLQGAKGIFDKQTPSPYWLIEIMKSVHHPDGRNLFFQDTFQLFWRNSYRAISVAPVMEELDSLGQTQEGDSGLLSINYFFIGPDATDDVKLLLLP